MYKQINTSNELTYQEELSIGEYFPELVNLPSVVMDYNITIRDGHRYTVYGCQDGTVKCFMVDVITNNVLKCMSSDYFDGPITSVNLFNSSSSSEVVNHLLVTLSLNPSAAVYKDIFNGDGSCNDPLILPSSHHHDSISCSALADLTFANQSELIIGSYGKVLLIYKVAHRGKRKHLLALKRISLT
jgi:endoglucanase Acf2